MNRTLSFLALTTATACLALAPATAAVANPDADFLGYGPRYHNNPNAVLCVQESLDLETHGRYDRDTYDQVRQFQEDQGLDVDGIVGPLTGDDILMNLPTLAWMDYCYPLLPSTY